jgi:hypothetical protein
LVTVAILELGNFSIDSRPMLPVVVRPTSRRCQGRTAVVSQAVQGVLLKRSMCAYLVIGLPSAARRPD